MSTRYLACSPPFTRVIQHLFEGRPPFPRCAVDEWGFVSEATDAKVDAWLHAQMLGLRRHELMRKKLSELLQYMRFFLMQARSAIELQPEMAIATTQTQRQFVEMSARQSGVDPNSPRLSLRNLASAWQLLPEVQRLFRNSFAHHVDLDSLAQMEDRERLVYEQLFAIWCEFVCEPYRMHRDNIEQVALNSLRDDLNKLRKKILDGFYAHNVFSRRGPLRQIRDDFAMFPGLWLLLDVQESRALDDVLNQAVKFLSKMLKHECRNERRALQVQGSWATIHIVTLMRGRLLHPTCIRVSSAVLMNLGPDCVRVPEEIPNEVSAALGLLAWDHPLLDSARRYLQLCLRMRALSMHHTELAEHGYINQVHSYAERLEQRFEDSVLALHEAHSQLLSTLAEIEGRSGSRVHVLRDEIVEGLTAPLEGDGDTYEQLGRLLRVPNPETVWEKTLEMIGTL